MVKGEANTESGVTAISINIMFTNTLRNQLKHKKFNINAKYLVLPFVVGNTSSPSCLLLISF